MVSQRRLRIEPLEDRRLLAARPIITEFMADNAGTLLDGSDPAAYEDWIEIYNAGDEAVNLSGWHLTDRTGNLSKWTFPDAPLPAGAFMVVFASGNDGPDAAGNPHTNFRLEALGEYLALSDPDEQVVSEYLAGGVNYPRQRPDVSFGIGVDETVTPLAAADATVRYLVPAGPGDVPGDWTALGFDDSTFADGIGALGYNLETPPPGFPGFQVQMVGVDGTVDTASTAEAVMAVADGTTGQKGQFDVTLDVAEQATAIDYGGNFGTFSVNNPFPNGSADGTTEQFVVQALTYATIPAGTWQIALGSDDGGRLILDGVAFSSRFNTNGVQQTEDEIRFETPRGHAWTGGTFTVGDAPIVAALDAIMFEATGGDSFELAIRDASGGESASVSVAGGWALLSDGQFGWNLSATAGTSPDGPVLNPGGAGVIGQITRSGGDATNVAPTGTATQSSTLGGFTSNLAIDGNPGNFTHTTSGDVDPSWTLALPSDQAIDSIQLHNRDGCCQSRLRDVNVIIRNAADTADLFNFQTETGGLLNPENTGYVFPGGPAQLDVDLVALTGGPVTGRIVRVTRTSDPDLSGTGGQGNNDEADVLSLGEVLVMGGASPDYQVESGLTLEFDLDATAGVSDRLIVQGALTLDGTVDLAARLIAGGLGTGDSFDLLDFGTLSGSFDQITLPNLAPGLVWDTSSLLADGSIAVVVDPDPDPDPDPGTDPLPGNSTAQEIQQYEALLGTDLAGAMFEGGTVVLARIPFTVDAAAAIDTLRLRMRYDDGFVAFLNGQEVARAGSPATLAWDSVSTVERTKTEALAEQIITLSFDPALLNVGPDAPNVLAIAGLNLDPIDNDFLLLATLEGVGVDSNQDRYFDVPTPGQPNDLGFFGVVEDVVTSRQRGFYDVPFSLSVTTGTPDATIRYTTDGRPPTDGTGTIYTGPITIGRTTTLRVAAFKDDYLSSAVATHTFIFPEDVLTQDYQATLDAGFPTSWAGTAPDYGVDTDVVGPGDIFGGKFADQAIDSLLAVPTLSIVMSVDDMFGSSGIYSNPGQSGFNWEKATSVELIQPDGSDGFQVDAGIRIQGGAFRSHGLTKKKSFRLAFRERYGPTKLEFPLFDAETAADRFDTITLRANNNDGWQWGAAGAIPQYIRDEFGRAAQLAMGQPGSHGTFYQLYINGMYWGVYNAVERPDASFSSSYSGGDKDDWDGINSNQAINGTTAKWNALQSAAATVSNAATEPERTAALMALWGKNPDGTDDPGTEALLDVENYIDYMILNIYLGNSDWPNKNYYTGRLRGPESTGFQYYSWDSEWSLGLRSDLNANRTGVSSGVAAVYGQLRASEEFRLMFADRVRKHFSEGGIFYVDPDGQQYDPARPEQNRPAALYQSLADQVELALIGESARWGDQHRATPYTADDWRTERDNLLANYFPYRSARVLDQITAANLYPIVEAPVFLVDGQEQQGGRVDAGAVITMFSPDTINYVDAKLIDTGADAFVYLPADDSLGSAWTEWDYVPGADWTAGPTGIGYDRNSGYQTMIGTDVEAGMYNVLQSALVRVPFTFDTSQDVGQLILKMKYDDAFVAYLNGTEVARSNNIVNATPGSVSVGSHEAGGTFDEFNITAGAGLLRDGPNVLAIHGMNTPLTSSDFIVLPELVARIEQIGSEGPAIYYSTDGRDPRQLGGQANPNATLLTGEFSLAGTTRITARALDGATWSARSEAMFVAPTPLAVTEVHYNPAPPTAAESALDPAWTADDFEFIELQNTSPLTVNLLDAQFSDGVGFRFPGLALAPGQFAVVASNLAAFATRYGTAGINVAGEFTTGNLNNGGERITLLDAAGDVIQSFAYQDNAPWPKTADGAGFSLVLKDPAGEPEHANAFQWRASADRNGSPGAADPDGPPAIVVSEALTNSDGTATDTVELFNPTGTNVDLGGWYLTDDAGTPRKFRIPADTIIPAGGFLTFDETDFNPGGGLELNDFALGADGDEVFLFSADPDDGALTGYVHGFAFGAADDNVAFIRHVDSTGFEHFTAQSGTPGMTLGGPNNPFRAGEVAITELHYNPNASDATETFRDEFIEIQNVGGREVRLFDPDHPENTWKINGAGFSFPTGTTLVPGEVVLVVGIDPAVFRATYGVSAEVRIFGPMGGGLSDGGEQISLQRPGRVVPELPLPMFIDVDVVRYGDSPPWTTLPDGMAGDGSSLTRMAADNFGSDPASWTAAEPTPGTAFTVRAVVGRHTFYNDSVFDAVDDADAIAPDKRALSPGERATAANYTSYEHGINGIIIDLLNPPGTLSDTDFVFRVGKDGDPSGWQPAPAVSSLSIDPGAGRFGATRVSVAWPNGAIEGQWLQVTVAANGNTGLAEPDVFYYGNVIGEVTSAVTLGAGFPVQPLVNAADVIAIRDNPRGEFNPAAINDPRDVNRDRRVDALDMILARDHATSPLATLRPITPAVPIPPTPEPPMPEPAPKTNGVRPSVVSSTADTAPPSRPIDVPLPDATRLAKLLRRFGLRV